MNRREFLKFGGSALALAVLPPAPNAPPSLPDEQSMQVESRLGRVTTARAWVHSGPNPHSPRVGLRRYDDIVNILQEVQGVGHYEHNPTWYKLIGGYIYSSWVQPVEYKLNRPVTRITDTGLLAWVTMPYTDARAQPDLNLQRRYRLYYDSIFRVVDVHVSDEKPRQVWYGLRDGLTWSGVNWVRAEHLRVVPSHEMTSLSPQVEDKRILIELGKQWLTCFEGQDAVFETRIASGMQGMVTPQGTHRVLRKMPTTRMIGGEGNNYYDLPGIGFVTYFTAKGVAVHGTYWHNDYGRRRSHGCVNVPTAAAQWVYRWTRPDVPYDESRLVASEDDATIIKVVS
jgi:hypothetical protein